MKSTHFLIIPLTTCFFAVTVMSAPFEFLDNTLIDCDMYSKVCFHPIRISNENSLADIQFKSTDLNLMKIISVHPCEHVNATRGLKQLHCKHFNSTRSTYLIHLDPLMIGKASIELTCVSANCPIISRDVIIRAPQRFIDKFLQVYIVCFSMAISLLMGVMLDLQVIKRIIKMPVPVVIGFCSQYIFMPLLSYCFIILFKLDPAEGLALFFYGCSPGGTVSNNWTIIFNGDLDLSVILTFFSTISSLVMMPLWYYTLGSTIASKVNLTIPFFKLIVNLLFTILPTLLGLALSAKYPVIKVKVSRFIKYLVVCLILTFFTLTTYSKFYIFSLMHWQQWVVGPLLPWSGFLLGGLLAFCARLPVKQIFTISIETGLQNVGIAFLIIMLNFPSPEADYALLPLIGVTALTGLPLWIALLIKICVYWTKRVFCGASENDLLADEVEKKKFVPATTEEADFKSACQHSHFK